MGTEHDDRRTESDVTGRERESGALRDPAAGIGGHPINADETAPGEVMPHPGNRTGSPNPDRHPDSVDDEPGQDL